MHPSQEIVVVQIDDTLPLMPQAIRVYKLPSELLQLIEKPSSPENYRANFNDIQDICLRLHRMVKDKNTDLFMGCAAHLSNVKPQIDSIGNRESWEQRKSDEVATRTAYACFASVVLHRFKKS